MTLMEFLDQLEGRAPKPKVEVTGKDKYDQMIVKLVSEGRFVQNIGGLTNVIIHDKKCPSCKASIPVFEKIGRIIKASIPTYNFYPIELGQTISDGNGNTINGMALVKFFDEKGVPFVIQNGRVETVNGSPVFREVPFYVAYMGKVDPLRYVATIFNVQNPRFE